MHCFTAHLERAAKEEFIRKWIKEGSESKAGGAAGKARTLRDEKYIPYNK